MKRKCDYCDKEYEADERNLKRGWGLCCTKSCAANKRGLSIVQILRILSKKLKKMQSIKGFEIKKDFDKKATEIVLRRVQKNLFTN